MIQGVSLETEIAAVAERRPDGVNVSPNNQRSSVPTRPEIPVDSGH